MKSLLKPLIISTALSTLGLCFTISHAANEQISSLKITQQAIHAAHVYVYAFPLLESEGNSNNFTDNNLMISSNSLSGRSLPLGELLKNPLLILPDEVLPSTNTAEKSQSFFEMSALFNDKLQSVIAYFNDTTTVDNIDELADSSALTSSCKS